MVCFNPFYTLICNVFVKVLCNDLLFHFYSTIICLLHNYLRIDSQPEPVVLIHIHRVNADRLGITLTDTLHLPPVGQLAVDCRRWDEEGLDVVDWVWGINEGICNLMQVDLNRSAVIPNAAYDAGVRDGRRMNRFASVQSQPSIYIETDFSGIEITGQNSLEQRH